MLVLTRKCLESVVVGSPNGIEAVVKVTVVEIGRGRVRLGFEADDEMDVHRWEVWQQICAGRRPFRPHSDSVAPAA
jgi:carbon storage regulator CsrA